MATATRGRGAVATVPKRRKKRGPRGSTKFNQLMRNFTAQGRAPTLEYIEHAAAEAGMKLGPAKRIAKAQYGWTGTASGGGGAGTVTGGTGATTGRGVAGTAGRTTAGQGKASRYQGDNLNAECAEFIAYCATRGGIDRVLYVGGLVQGIIAGTNAART